MKFVSLNDLQGEAVSFQEALARGIAPDGGLYVPQSIPELSPAELDQLIGADRYKIAKIMLGPWLAGELPEHDLEAIIRRAASFDTPLVKVSNKYVLEMFHGPTMAFKDVAAGYLAAFMDYFNKKTGRPLTVLVATSGDTGGAIAHGFADIESINVVVLYPRGRVSRLQREQLRRTAKNVQAVEVKGDFNDCQDLVKKAFVDRQLGREFNLTSANSINVGRLLPQTTYYASIYSQLGKAAGQVVVPTGNLGNLTAGVLARAMGIPIAGFVAATNSNDIVARYLKDGKYQPKATVRTLSNAMDVNAPNNLPRLRWLFKDDLAATRPVIKAASVSDQETIETIKRVYKETGYLLDPHTAVGWRASELLGGKEDIIVATASPLKFAEEILAKTGIKTNNSYLLERLRQQPERYTEIGNNLADLKKALNEQKIFQS